MSLSGLPLIHRIAGKRVVVIGQGSAADAKRRLVERAGGICCGEAEAHHAAIGFVALDDPRTAEAAAIRLRCKGLLVNVADRPELCDFTLPSVLERGPVLIAVSTGGVSAGLAKQLRLRLETLLPASLGMLADRLYDAREAMRAKWPDAGDRRQALDEALTGPLDPLDEGAPDRVASWLDGAERANPPRTVEIALVSADPDDLTLRQARMLGQAEAVLHNRAPPQVLARARADAVSGSLNDADHPHGLTVRLTGP
jgi:uroporphyrin-III C-methyltransferase/precorrin-2 dehydrogenase/sirohydrochlorin ferrochelatase